MKKSGESLSVTPASFSKITDTINTKKQGHHGSNPIYPAGHLVFGKDMGKTMAALKERYAGRMDFTRAAQLVKQRLSAA